MRLRDLFIGELLHVRQQHDFTKFNRHFFERLQHILIPDFLRDRGFRNQSVLVFGLFESLHPAPPLPSAAENDAADGIGS